MSTVATLISISQFSLTAVAPRHQYVGQLKSITKYLEKYGLNRHIACRSLHQTELDTAITNHLAGMYEFRSFGNEKEVDRLVTCIIQRQNNILEPHASGL
jgi:hypothetical protein